MESLVPDFDEAVDCLKGSYSSQFDLFGVIAHTGEFLDWCDTTDPSLVRKIDVWLIDHVVASLLYREREANLPPGISDGSLAIPPELQVLRRVKYQGVTALNEYCHFRAERHRLSQGSGAVRLADQWEALADVVSTLSEVPPEVPRKLPVSAAGP